MMMNNFENRGCEENMTTCLASKMNFGNGVRCDKIEGRENVENCRTLGGLDLNKRMKGDCMKNLCLEEIDSEDYVVAFKNGDTSGILSMQEFNEKKESEENAKEGQANEKVKSPGEADELVGSMFNMGGLALASSLESGGRSKILDSLCGRATLVGLGYNAEEELSVDKNKPFGCGLPVESGATIERGKTADGVKSLQGGMSFDSKRLERGEGACWGDYCARSLAVQDDDKKKCLLSVSLNENDTKSWTEGEWAVYLLKNFRSMSARVRYINGMIDRFERSSVSGNYVARYGSLEQFFEIVIDLIHRKKMIIDSQLFVKRLVEELSSREKLVIKYFITRDSKVLSSLLSKMSRRTVYRVADKAITKIVDFMKARGYTSSWCYQNFDQIIHTGL